MLSFVTLQGVTCAGARSATCDLLLYHRSSFVTQQGVTCAKPIKLFSDNWMTCYDTKSDGDFNKKNKLTECVHATAQ